MKKEKKYKLSKKEQPFFNFFKKIIALFLRKPKLINFNDNLNSKSITVSNHFAKIGPFYLEMYYPLFTYKWGAGEMLGNFKSRFLYLRDVYYMRKLGHKKLLASIRAGFEAIFSPLIYKGVKVIGTYTDARFKSTISESIHVLNNNVGIMIYPEDSNQGYKDVLTDFFGGFIALSKIYYRKFNEDLPVYPTYVNYKKRIILIDKPLYVNELLNKGISEEEIRNIFKEKVNNLFFNFIENNKYKEM